MADASEIRLKNLSGRDWAADAGVDAERQSIELEPLTPEFGSGRFSRRS